MTTQDVNVVLLDLPTKEKEAVTKNEDGSFTIIINSKLSYKGQLLAYKHAMKHIQDNDFQKYNVQAIEASAHSIKTSNVPVRSKRSQSKKCPDWLKAIRARNKKLHMELDRYVEVYDSHELSDSQQWFGQNP